MLKTFTRVMLLCFILCGLGTTPTYATTIRFESDTSSIQVGDTLEVDIVISDLDNQDLYVFDFEVNFEDTILQYESYTLGSGLGDIISTDMFDFFADAYDSSDGYIGSGTLALSEMSWLSDLSNQADEFVLATLTFTGLNDGISELSIRSIVFGDGSSNPINVSIETSNIIVTDVSSNPAPEPSTMVLFAMGALSFVCVHRQKILNF